MRMEKKSKTLKEREYISLLAKTPNKKQRSALIDLASPTQLESILEIVQNILNSNIPLNTKNKRNLSKYKKELRQLCKKNLSTKKKKSILKQKGGILNLLLPLAVSALSSIIPAIFKRKK